MKKLSVYILILGVLGGCAKGQQTKTVFNLKSLSNLDPSVQSLSENGIVIFGFNDRGHRFAKILNTADNFDHELDNGTWTFKAVAWDRTISTENFTGKPHCAIARVQLFGSEVSIDLPLNNDTCAEAPFAASKFTGTVGSSDILFKPLNKIQSCHEGIGLDAGFSLDECGYSLSSFVSTRSSTDIARGYASSFKILTRSYYKGINNTFVGSATLESCINASETNAGIQLPSGLGFNFTVQAYTRENCEAGSLINERLLPSGANTNHLNVATKLHSISSDQQVFLKTTSYDVCKIAPDLSANPFHGGTGAVNNPYLICQPRQLNEIQNFPGSMGNSYRLLADLDMNQETEVFYAGSFYGSSIEHGRNFVPLGHSAGDCTATDFSGSFDGNNRTIKGLRMDNFQDAGVDCSNVGLFASINGATIARLNFEKTEIEGKSVSNVGLLAGFMQASSVYQVHAKIVDLRVDESQGNIGGLVGLSSSSNISEISINDLRLDADVQADSYNNYGGLIGISTSDNIKNVSVRGSVSARAQNGVVFQNVGGLVGFKDDGSFVGGMFSGNVHGTTRVGGAIGYVGASAMTALSNILVKGHVIARADYNGTTCKAYAGGIIGQSFTGTALQESFFLGEMSIEDNHCNGVPADFYGSITGSTSNASTRSWSQKTISGTNGESGTLASSTFNTDASLLSTWLSASNIYWTHTVGDHPRLAVFNEHPCAQIENQKDLSLQTGRGIASNPYIICSERQMGQIESVASSGSHLKLADDIYLSAGGVAISSFDGILDGQRKFIWGIDKVFIDTNNGSLKNIHFDKVNISSAVSGDAFIRINNGELDGVSAFGGISSTSDSIAFFVNENNGTINNGSVHGYVNAYNAPAGILSLNNHGRISRMRVNGDINISNSIGTIMNVGAVASFNNSGAIIQEVNVELKVKIAKTSLAGSESVGGIAGDNDGHIKNSVVRGVQTRGWDGSADTVITNLVGLVTGSSTVASNDVNPTIYSIVASINTDGAEKIVGQESGTGLTTRQYIIDNRGAPTIISPNSGFTTLFQFTGEGWDAEQFDNGGSLNPDYIDYYRQRITGIDPTVLPSRWEFDPSAVNLEDRLRLFYLD